MSEDIYFKELLARLDSAAPSRPPIREESQVSLAVACGVMEPPEATPPRRKEEIEAKIEELKQRLSGAAPQNPIKPAVAPPVALASPKASALPTVPSVAAAEAVASASAHHAFIPPVPKSFAEAKLSEAEVQALILKFLMNQIAATGRDVSEQLHTPFCLTDQLLGQLKADQLVVHKGAAMLGDYVYQLTAAGHEEARRLSMQCSYFGAAPVHLSDYIHSVTAQSVTRQKLTAADLKGVFDDLVLNTATWNQVGQAVYAGQGFFVYGAPGNGKTSIAERVARAYGQHIWIPRAITVDGEIIRLFDPCNHIEEPINEDEDMIDPKQIDQRWVRIRRPTIVVGGELTLERLEVAVNKLTGINEAPLQLKSNCGVLVIDDFGRQRVSIIDLLNRWIVPLDKRYDYLNLPSGKTIQVPFDQILIFSTNLEPKDLVDEAFLRRIPYKIEVHDPTETEFRRLFHVLCRQYGFAYCEDSVQYLLDTHYRKHRRSLRYCHPRDLLRQVRSYCEFNGRPLVLSPEAFDVAVGNYFAIMG